MILFQIYMLVCILLLAGKDATSYKLKDKNADDEVLERKRIIRWHRDGAILNALFVIPFLYFDPPNWHIYIFCTIILRLIVYDISFNYWAGLQPEYLGSTAWWDKQFIKIFGENGAIKKSLVFSGLLILVNIFL